MLFSSTLKRSWFVLCCLWLLFSNSLQLTLYVCSLDTKPTPLSLAFFCFRGYEAPIMSQLPLQLVVTNDTVTIKWPLKCKYIRALYFPCLEHRCYIWQFNSHLVSRRQRLTTEGKNNKLAKDGTKKRQKIWAPMVMWSSWTNTSNFLLYEKN